MNKVFRKGRVCAIKGCSDAPTTATGECLVGICEMKLRHMGKFLSNLRICRFHASLSSIMSCTGSETINSPLTPASLLKCDYCKQLRILTNNNSCKTHKNKRLFASCEVLDRCPLLRRHYETSTTVMSQMTCCSVCADGMEEILRKTSGYFLFCCS